MNIKYLEKNTVLKLLQYFLTFFAVHGIKNAYVRFRSIFTVLQYIFIYVRETVEPAFTKTTNFY